jgi:hypothetical protein
LPLLLSYAVEIRQFDVSSAFLDGDLAETVYLKLPEAHGGKIWKLQKALYGLKQAARAWYAKLRSVMQGLSYYFAYFMLMTARWPLALGLQQKIWLLS